jgi:hypothetical protein
VTCRLEYAIITCFNNDCFCIECVAQYAQNTRERLQELKELQEENARLKRIDADQAIDMAILKEEGNTLIKTGPKKWGRSIQTDQCIMRFYYIYRY